MTGEPTITLTLRKDEAIVLDDCLARLFGEGDLHDWEDASLAFERECEQWPFFSVRDALAVQLNAELTASNYPLILETARKNIATRQWGE